MAARRRESQSRLGRRARYDSSCGCFRSERRAGSGLRGRGGERERSLQGV